MTAAKPLHTTHGIDLIEYTDGTVEAWRPGYMVGTVSPWVMDEPNGPWYARRTGADAVKVDTRHAALAYAVGGCPDCVCNPVLCESDETGASCMDCGACLHGCPEDECDMMKETNRRD